MKDSIKHIKKNELVKALQKVPQCREMCIRTYLGQLEKLFKDFQSEIEWNIYIKNSYCFTIDYVTDLITDFKYLYMTMDGTFDILIFPEIISEFETKKYPKIKNCFDSHKFIYLRTISMLQQKENIVKIKITHKIPLVDTNQHYIQSKYVLKDGSTIDIVELGTAIYYKGNIAYRSGENLPLHAWLTDVAAFVGEEIKNVYQRGDEMRNRANPYKYLESLLDVAKKSNLQTIDNK